MSLAAGGPFPAACGSRLVGALTLCRKWADCIPLLRDTPSGCSSFVTARSASSNSSPAKVRNYLQSEHRIHSLPNSSSMAANEFSISMANSRFGKANSDVIRECSATGSFFIGAKSGCR